MPGHSGKCQCLLCSGVRGSSVRAHTELLQPSASCRLSSCPCRAHLSSDTNIQHIRRDAGEHLLHSTPVMWYKPWHLGATYENQHDFPQPLIAMQHLMHLTLIFLAGDNNISYEICRLLPNSQILAAKPKEGADRAGKMRSNLMQMFCTAPQAPWLGMSKKFKCSFFNIMENWLLLTVYKVF